VKTSVLSTRWTSLWLWVPRLELDSGGFSDFNAFKSFGDRFFDSDRVSSIHKLELTINDNGDGVDDTSYLTSWIDNAVKRKVQHLHVPLPPLHFNEIPISLYICETLVSLKLFLVALPDAEFFSLPCLKIMRLDCITYPNEATFERLVSSSHVLEELEMEHVNFEPTVFRVLSKSLKRLTISIQIYFWDSGTGILIDAPRLHFLGIYDNLSESFIVTNMDPNVKLDLDLSAALFLMEAYILSARDSLRSFLPLFTKIRDMFIHIHTFKLLCHCLNLEPLPQFGYMSCLQVCYDGDYGEMFSKEMMNQSSFSQVPQCLLSSLEFVDCKVLRGLAADMELVRFIYSDNESWIRKLQLSIGNHHGMCDISSWIDVVARRRIQHIDVSFDISYRLDKIPPLRLYTCETLVHLRLYGATLVDAEFVALPCLKILHLDLVRYPNESTLEKLISGSPVLEDLTIYRYLAYNAKVLHVRSQTVKRIHIDHFEVVIDAPLLQYLRTKIYETKKFEIINLGFFTKLDIHVICISHRTYNSSMIHDIITDISRVRELVINNGIWKDIFLYLKSGPVQQFQNLSSLNAKFTKSDLEFLPLILESCPKLESLTLELVEKQSMSREKKIDPKVVFSTVPQCLVSSLKFVELKRSISGYKGERELIRYLLKNSTILKKLRLDLYYSQRAMNVFLKELVAMPKCSTGCEVLVL
ncbi:FBD domain, partial [Arabidopsis suecica]